MQGVAAAGAREDAGAVPPVRVPVRGRGRQRGGATRQRRPGRERGGHRKGRGRGRGDYQAAGADGGDVDDERGGKAERGRRGRARRSGRGARRRAAASAEARQSADGDGRAQWQRAACRRRSSSSARASFARLGKKRRGNDIYSFGGIRPGYCQQPG